MNNFKHFCDILDRSIADFEKNILFQKISAKTISTTEYTNLLKILFHQTLHAAPTFALAGTNTPTRLMKVREYLLEHAGEETRHWSWLQGDLETLGATDPAILDSTPAPSALEYIGMNYYFAMTKPLARLGTAAMLEGVGARFGSIYGAELIKQLKLPKNAVVFITSHGTTDVEHTEEIFELIKNEKLTTCDFQDLIFGVESASRVYRRMYEDSVEQGVKKCSA